MVQKENKEIAKVFTALSAKNTQCENKEQMRSMLELTFGRWLADGLLLLLDNVDEQVRTSFIIDYLTSGRLVLQTHTTVVVRQTPATMKRTGNVGRYIVCFRMPDGQERLARFTHQASTVFYLFCLIHRSQNEGTLLPPSLQRNARIFQEVYLSVYDNILPATVAQRHQDLLFRKSGNAIRAGRLNQVIYDIRQHLKTLFAPYAESFIPYAMTAHEQLALPPSKIVFEGEAKLLLKHHVL